MKKILLFGLVLITGTIVQGQPARKKIQLKRNGEYTSLESNGERTFQTQLSLWHNAPIVCR